MKICLTLEGSYPYIKSGFSDWIHNYIEGLPDCEFILWVIGSNAAGRGNYAYPLPGNVTDIRESFLDNARPSRARVQELRLTPGEQACLRELMNCGSPDWDMLLELFQSRRCSAAAFMQSEAFLQALTQLCLQDYPYLPFSSVLVTVRSMLLPVLNILGQDAPEADIFHAMNSGYAGLLACVGGYAKQKPVLLTEQNISVWEREEEITRTEWMPSVFKEHWARFFRMLSACTCSRAFRVTSPYAQARQMQIKLGCLPEHCRVIPNGVNYAALSRLPRKQENGMVDIGAIARIAPVKDIKTMLYAFSELHSRVRNVRLHILGDAEDTAYAKECASLIKSLGLTNIVFPGRVDIMRYLPKLDLTLLTSISEGQPLAVLESLAAGLPVVTTDVGCCGTLIGGMEGDTLGLAGYCVPARNSAALAEAMEKLCASQERRLEMGLVGQKRAALYYQQHFMLRSYRNLYDEAEAEYGTDRI